MPSLSTRCSLTLRPSYSATCIPLSHPCFLVVLIYILSIYAEASTDLHNMLLFLQRDSARTVPAGFENTIFNFFDPDTPGVEDNDDADYASSVDTDVGCESNNGEPHSADGSDGNTSKDEGKATPKTCACSRKGCNVRARFDSMFCSDGCGVSVAEGDLLKSMELAATLHPSALSRGIQYT